jgi:hypothetical protein
MFKRIKDAVPPYDDWVDDVKIRCSLYDLPVPNRKHLKAEYKNELKKEVYEGLGYKLKVTRNLAGMPYRDTPEITNLIGDHMIWVEITRLDDEPVTSWDDKQMIKNFIGGEKLEGVELYPKTQRVHAHGNACHLWIMKREDAFFPFGFPHGFDEIKKEVERKDEDSVH